MSRSVHQFGDRAVLVDLPAGEAARLVAESLLSQLSDCKVRAGMQSVLVERDRPDFGLMARVAAALENVSASPSLPDVETRTHLVKVDYNGVDLHRVAELMRIQPADVVALHSQTLWQVALIGFAPGFPYLIPVAGTAFADLPRLSEPRTRVPAGAVAIAAGMSCIYPSAMPGGWNLIGTTQSVLFDPGWDSPSLMQQGDLVKFEERL